MWRGKNENLNCTASEEFSNTEKTVRQYQQYQRRTTVTSSAEEYDYCGRHFIYSKKKIKPQFDWNTYYKTCPESKDTARVGR